MRFYFNKHKHSMFPEVTDWTSHQEQYRFNPKPGDMKMKFYLFFHPSAYLIAMLGTNIMTFLLFGGAAVWFYFRGLVVLAVIMLFVSVNGILALIKNIKNYEIIKLTTFYDLWMRE